MVSSLRNSLHRRSHKERAQPANRVKLGLLEKKKDYVVRARAYHLKQDQIKRLQVKAHGRNKDEFYFAMNKEKTNRGVHVKYRENASLSTEIAVVLKSQDANYIRTMRKQGLKQIESLKAQLTALADLVSSSGLKTDDGSAEEDQEDDDDEDDRSSDDGTEDGDDEESDESDPEEESLRRLDQEELAILRKAGILHEPRTRRRQNHATPGRHIVFVQDQQAAVKYKPRRPYLSSTIDEVQEDEPPDLGWIVPDDQQRKNKAAEKARLAHQAQQEEDERLVAEAKKHRSKLLKELAARLDRDKHLRYAEQELEMQRLTMAGKGSHQKLRDPEQLYQGTGEEEDEFTFRRKGHMPVVELGNEVYKPKVVKWRQERKK